MNEVRPFFVGEVEENELLSIHRRAQEVTSVWRKLRPARSLVAEVRQLQRVQLDLPKRHAHLPGYVMEDDRASIGRPVQAGYSQVTTQNLPWRTSGSRYYVKLGGPPRFK